MSGNLSPQAIDCQKRLHNELSRLKRVLGMDEDLRLEWTPRRELSKSGKELSGEVKGNVVFIYDEDYCEALKTLRHELIDYCVSQAIEPYKEVTNRLIKMINDEAYKRKEKVVEALTRLIGKTE